MVREFTCIRPALSPLCLGVRILEFPQHQPSPHLTQTGIVKSSAVDSNKEIWYKRSDPARHLSITVRPGKGRSNSWYGFEEAHDQECAMTGASAEDKLNEHADGDMLLRDLQDGICTLTLNRPRQRNALSRDLILALIRELDEIAQDAAIRVVILAGNGPVFSSGHDLRELRDNPSEKFYRQLFEACSSLMMKIITLPQPVIARVHGPASAAGCQLVATCDLAVAAKTATFATPGVNIGLFCSTPMVALSRNVSRKHAMRMLLSGEPVSAARAHEMGLVSDVTETENLDTACLELAQLIASKSRQAVKIGKEAFYRQLELGIKEAYDFAGDVMTINMSKEDAAEGIGAFLDKRDPQWKK